MPIAALLLVAVLATVEHESDMHDAAFALRHPALPRSAVVVVLLLSVGLGMLPAVRELISALAAVREVRRGLRRAPRTRA